MMERNRRLPLTAGCIAGGATLAGIICRTVALLKHFDAEVGYFDTSFVSVAGTVLCFAAVIGMAACAILIPRENTLPTVRATGSHDLAGVVPLAAFLIFCVVACIKRTALMSIRLNPAGTGLSMRTSVTILILLAVGGTVFGLLTLFGIRNTDARGGTGFFPVLWGLLVIAVTYMDQYTAMNSPLKVGIMFATLGMMAAMTSELRFVFGKPAPRTYMAFTGCGVFFCLVGTVPYLIATLAGALPRHELYPLVCCTVAMMGIFFAVRLIRYLRACMTPSPAKPDTPEKEETEKCA